MKITLYSTNCPKCNVLKTKLDQKKIPYVECNDVDEMIAKGIHFAPALYVEENLLDFSEAIKWVNAQEVRN